MLFRGISDTSRNESPIHCWIGGFESNVGKTTLLCDLLREFPAWEAIKTARGHYRSCGKDPHACCVSHLLSEEPLILSGKRETYSDGKDTGRYWSAGASNVHWLIVTEGQVEKGIKEVLERVKSPGVLIEGNSFAKFVKPDYFVMVARNDSKRMKTSAKQTLELASAIVLTDTDIDEGLHRQRTFEGSTKPKKVYSPLELRDLISEIRLAAQREDSEASL